jgi:hypothetical protein
VFKLEIEPVTVSIEFNLPFALEVNVFKELVDTWSALKTGFSPANIKLVLLVNVLKLEVRVYLGANDAVLAFVVVPLIFALIIPRTVKSPCISAEEETDREPDMCASNIFI